MMYEKYAPTLKLERTISHPFDPAKVAGFRGRNTFLGTDAVVLKSENLPGDEMQPEGTFCIPNEAAQLVNSGWDLVVLDGESVYVLPPDQFESVRSLHTFHDAGDKDTMYVAPRPDLIEWSRSRVGIKL